MSQAQDYLPKPPGRLPFSLRTYVDATKRSMATFHVLLRHTLSAYGKAPSSKEPITSNSPKGTIRPKMLQRIEQLWGAAKLRSEHLEQKSTATLSGLGIAAPIVIALSVFIVKEPSISTWIRYTALVLVALAIASMVMSFLAILRALSIREREELGIDSVVASRAFRKATDDFHGRGLLYVYTKQQAINDHVADFIRASQMFLAVSIALVLLAGAVIVPGTATAVGRQKSASDPVLLELNHALEALAKRLGQIEDLRSEQIRVQQDVARLRFEIQHPPQSSIPSNTIAPIASNGSAAQAATNRDEPRDKHH